MNIFKIFRTKTKDIPVTFSLQLQDTPAWSYLLPKLVPDKYASTIQPVDLVRALTGINNAQIYGWETFELTNTVRLHCGYYLTLNSRT